MQLVIFIFCTLILVWISRRCLLQPRSHGFYRFFAFEGIAALVVIQQPVWFVQPFSPLHLLAWFLLFISIVLVIMGLRLLRELGGRGERQEGNANFAFENTARLVEHGLYKYIRHPMYASLLFLAWGGFLKRITWLSSVLIMVVTMALIATALVEERENRRFFGQQYDAYRRRTKMFIPWLL